MKKEAKKRMLYSSVNEDFERVKQWMEENSDHMPTDEEVWDEIHELAQQDWEDFTYEFEDFFNDGNFVLQGTVGRWDGTYGGGYTFETFRGLCKAFSGCDYVEIYDCNGHLYIDCSHHDGSNHFEIRMLTERGRDFANRNCDYMDDRTLHTKLMDSSNYSKLPHAAHTVFGCKRIEYVKGE